MKLRREKKLCIEYAREVIVIRHGIMLDRAMLPLNILFRCCASAIIDIIYQQHSVACRVKIA